MKPSERLHEATKRANVPLSCTLELTRRCNLKCRHCYIERPAAARSSELSYRKIRVILDQLAAAGTLYLTLTGGGRYSCAPTSPPSAARRGSFPST